jgi:hypothetical protein
LVALFPWTQTRTIAGSSLTAHTAEQVTPARPALPSVVTTDTAVATLHSAPRNCAAETQPIAAAGEQGCCMSSGICDISYEDLARLRRGAPVCCR